MRIRKWFSASYCFRPPAFIIPIPWNTNSFALRYIVSDTLDYRNISVFDLTSSDNRRLTTSSYLRLEWTGRDLEYVVLFQDSRRRTRWCANDFPATELSRLIQPVHNFLLCVCSTVNGNFYDITYFWLMSGWVVLFLGAATWTVSNQRQFYSQLTADKTKH